MPIHKKIAQPTIALCVIARDEEALLADCLDSARPFVDEIIVLDTGSTDRTIEIARAHGARIGEFTWSDDFAAAKNAALDLVTADWALFLDADERLAEGGPQLHQLAVDLPAGASGYELPLDNLIDDNIVTHHAARFFPHRADLRFRGAIHEAVVNVPAPEATIFAATSVVRLLHLGYQADLYLLHAKDQRNLRILMRELERDPDDARALFYVALQHLTRGRPAQAVLYLRRCIAHADQLPPKYLNEVDRMHIQALLNLDDFSELDRVATAAETARGLTPFARELLATYAIAEEKFDVAIKHLQAALDPAAPSGLQAPAGCGSWRTHGQLANVYERLGDVRACFESMQHAAQSCRAADRAKYALITARLAALLGQADVALRWLLVAGEWADQNIQLHVEILRERLQLAQPAIELSVVEQAMVGDDWQAAYQAALVLPLDQPVALAQLLLVGDRLREQGAPDAALDLLNRALDGGAPSAAVYWRLTQTLSDAGRHEDAVMASDVLNHIPGANASIFAA